MCRPAECILAGAVGTSRIVSQDGDVLGSRVTSGHHLDWPCAMTGSAGFPPSDRPSAPDLVQTFSALQSLLLDVAPSGPPLTVTQKLKATGTVVKSTAAATVHGTVTCSKPTYANIGVTVEQGRKGVETEGSPRSPSPAARPRRRGARR